jgi:DNA-binding GntR family transcriptional regulator
VIEPSSPRLEPVAAPNIRDLVYARLKQGILTHQFAPGSQLLARQLAAQLNTSTTPVVQVILQLAREGLVEVIPRRGTFVADLTADRIRQLFEAADAIESYAARLAAARVTERDIADLREILAAPSDQTDLSGTSGNNTPQRFEKDSRFHTRLVALSGNLYLINMYQTIDSQVWTFVRMRLARDFERIQPFADAGHNKIVRSLARRDQEGVVEAIREHNSQILAQYERVLEAHPEARRKGIRA